MRKDSADQVRAVEASMIGAAEGYDFGESELEALRVVARLAVEFYYLLRGTDLDALSPLDLSYECESVFAGVDFFDALSGACRGTVGLAPSTLRWDLPLSLASLQGRFIATYEEFASETDFGKRCRLLLDLFKLQLVFAGVSYE